jgi:hypothetical protein
VLDYANTARGTKPLVDVVGTNEQSDVAVQQTTVGFRVAVVNYGEVEIEVQLKPIGPTRAGEWFDLAHQRTIINDNQLKMKVPARGFRAVEFK